MALAQRIEHVKWSRYIDWLSANWRQGEHFSLIGPTGQGKTTFALGVLPIRKYTIIFVTKPKDKTLTGLTAKTRAIPERYVIERKWPYGAGKAPSNRVLLWPKARSIEDEKKEQRAVFISAIEGAYGAGGWCIFADDLWYLCRVLGLANYFETLWANGRAIGLSLFSAVQRPAFVPLMAYDQATHLAFTRDNDETNLRRIGGIGSVDSRLIRSTVPKLKRYEFLYVNTRTGDMAITKVGQE